MPELVVRGAKALIRRWDEPPLIDAWLAVSAGRVEAVGRGAPPHADQVLEADGGLVIPGMVAAHHHLFQGASRGIAADGGLLDWLAVHYRAWAGLTEADVEAAAGASLSLLALGGTSTVAAFEYLHPPGADLVEPVVRAAERVGLRLLLVRGCAPRLEGRLAERLAAERVDLSRLVEPEEVALRETARLLARPTSERLRFACGPTTPVLDDGGAFQRALNEVADTHGVGVHTHFHPLPGSLAPGESALDLARRAGLARRGNWFAHGSRLSERDVAALGAAGVGVVHAPSCSLLLGYPIPPLARWSGSNERVAVSVDGSASNDRSSMLLEAQLALGLQRAVHGAEGAPGARAIMELVTESAARTIGWLGLGRLEPGSAADLAVVDPGSLELSGVPGSALAQDPADVLMRTYAGGRVRHLVVGARVVVREGRLTGVDERAVAAAASAAADRLYGPAWPSP